MKQISSGPSPTVFRALLLVLIGGVFCPPAAQLSSDDMAVVEKFVLRTHPGSRLQLEYRLFVPEGWTFARTYPLVLTLHGAGDNYDSQAQIAKHPLAVVWARDSIQDDDPCFVVSPRINGRWVNTDWGDGSYDIDNVAISSNLATTVELLDSLQREFPIDTNRVYVTGLSMGGFGTWDIAMRYPRRFAAIAPMCGGADPSRAEDLVHQPIWTTHGTADGIIPVSATREMVSALVAAGKTPLYTHCVPGGDCNAMTLAQQAQELENGADLVYAEYQNRGHVEAWRGDERGYDNPLLVRWVLSHGRSAQTRAAPRVFRSRFTDRARGAMLHLPLWHRSQGAPGARILLSGAKVSAGSAESTHRTPAVARFGR